MITLTMERLDHAVVLKLPTDHEHVMVALWRLGLNRDPHMYTLGELNAVFSYDTPEEHQMVRLIDMNNSQHFALCSLHETLAPLVPYAQQLRKKLQSGSYRSAKDFYYDMESLVFDPKHMMTYFYFPVSGEVVAKDGSVTKADDDMLCDYHKMIEFAMYTVQSQTYFWETELFSDVKGVPEKLAFAGWSIEEMDGVLFGEVLLMHLEPFTDEEMEDLAEKIEQINSIDFAIRMKHWSVLTDAGLLHLYLCSEDGDYSLINPDDFLDDEEEADVCLCPHCRKKMAEQGLSPDGVSSTGRMEAP